MKKLLIILIVFLVVIFGIVTYATIRIEEEITADALPKTVYAGDKTPKTGMEDTVVALFDPMGENDSYTLVELFINYVIYDSIKENINKDYDPLGDCDETVCSTIIETDQISIKYAYAHLNDDNQIILTVSAHRFNYPSFNTAIHLTFDVSIDVLERSFVLTLNQTHLADDEISERLLDRMLGFLDTEAIEDSVSTGTLDLDDKTYTYTYID